MDETRARHLIAAKRAELSELLSEAQQARQEDRVNSQDAGDMVDPAQGIESESARPEDRVNSQDAGDMVDPAQGIESESVDDAVAESVRLRLAELDRAEQRLADGTYGRSVRSGAVIPDERLEVEPGAELTVEEAAEA